MAGTHTEQSATRKLYILVELDFETMVAYRESIPLPASSIESSTVFLTTRILQALRFHKFRGLGIRRVRYTSKYHVYITNVYRIIESKRKIDSRGSTSLKGKSIGKAYSTFKDESETSLCCQGSIELSYLAVYSKFDSRLNTPESDDRPESLRFEKWLHCVRLHWLDCIEKKLAKSDQPWIPLESF